MMRGGKNAQISGEILISTAPQQGPVASPIFENFVNFENENSRNFKFGVNLAVLVMVSVHYCTNLFPICPKFHFRCCPVVP